MYASLPHLTPNTLTKCLPELSVGYEEVKQNIVVAIIWISLVYFALLWAPSCYSPVAREKYSCRFSAGLCTAFGCLPLLPLNLDGSQHLPFLILTFLENASQFFQMNFRFGFVSSCLGSGFVLLAGKLHEIHARASRYHFRLRSVCTNAEAREED